MATKTIDNFGAVTVAATTDTFLVTQAAVTKKETLAQLDTLLSATTKTLTNKTLTSPVINTGVSGTAIDTDGTLTANSDTKIASQKAVKTYADTKQTLDSFLTSLAALGTAANKLLYSSGANTAAELEITANTFPMRSSAGNIAAKAMTDFALTFLDDTTAAAFKTTTLASGDIVQVVNTQTGAVATGSTALPYDDTIPQITEGDEYMTLAITPNSATNILKIDVVIHGATTAIGFGAALFRDATAGALAAGFIYRPADYRGIITFRYYIVAGSVSVTTFRVRAGGASGTFTLNGVSAGRKYGGVLASSITITEIQV